MYTIWDASLQHLCSRIPWGIQTSFIITCNAHMYAFVFLKLYIYIYILYIYIYICISLKKQALTKCACMLACMHVCMYGCMYGKQIKRVFSEICSQLGMLRCKIYEVVFLGEPNTWNFCFRNPEYDCYETST